MSTSQPPLDSPGRFTTPKAPCAWDALPRRHFGAILADPPWRFETWSEKGKGRSPERHYPTMSFTEIVALPVRELVAPDCVLFLWATWPMLNQAEAVITAWGFKYKTCGFLWVKARNSLPSIGTGYWTRANSEPCLLATYGHPVRVHADVSQVIIEPRREHSRKPDETYRRIERLVAGPYLELFARRKQMRWFSWGDQLEDAA